MTRPIETFVRYAPLDRPEESRTGRLSQRDDDGFFVASQILWPPGTALELWAPPPGESRPTRLHGVVSWARIREPSGMFVTLQDPPAPRESGEGPDERPTAATSARGVVTGE